MYVQVRVLLSIHASNSIVAATAFPGCYYVNATSSLYYEYGIYLQDGPVLTTECPDPSLVSTAYHQPLPREANTFL